MLTRRMLGLMSFCALSTPVNSAGQAGTEVRCDYLTRYVCDIDGCSRTLKDRNYLLVPSLPALEEVGELPGGGTVDIRLCDLQGCTAVPMHVELSGLYIYLTQENRGTQYMKIYASSERD